MKKNVLIYGLVLGLIVSINMILLVNLFYSNPDFEGNEIVGYAAMIIIFSLVFFGVRNYRNKELGGVISFGKAFKAGALIALIGATMYVTTWLIYYYNFVPDFFEKYSAHVLRQTAAEGATAEVMAEKTKEMQSFAKMYENPFYVILFTYSEVLPVGLILALFSSLVLKRKVAK